MFFRMMYDEALAQATYLIGCQRSGEAVVFDPLRDVDRLIDLASSHGLKIVAVAETHIHADFVSGARELAHRTGAHVYVSGEGGPDWRSGWLNAGPDGTPYAHTELRDGQSFDIGGVRVRAIHTPGHTPEHMVYLVTDRGSDATEPMGVVSGDFLFVGDLGRPDLLETAAGQTGTMREGAKALHASLSRLGELPEFCQVWPGHGAGSACGKALGAVPASTIGYERRFNPALRLAGSEGAFIDHILDGQPEPPMYFADMKRINRDGPPVLGALPVPRRVSTGELARLDPRAVAIVDARPWERFIAGHVPGSLSFPAGQSFSTDVGSMVRTDEAVHLVADEAEIDNLVRQLIRIGIDRIETWTPSAEVDAESPAGLASATIDEADVREVDQSDRARLDVRRLSEFNEGHMPGAVNISHTRLMGRLNEVPASAFVSCRSGKRSARATAYLKRMGHDVVNVRGGWLAWEAAGLEVSTD